ncbi:hypothetical protein TNCV_3778871 [Trichonephila clavipes]|nr:hypothetical protein TNCV_3778871 [Trichonephila clavipes]
MSYPGFEPRPYGIAASVTNHYSEWATRVNTDNSFFDFLLRLLESQGSMEYSLKTTDTKHLKWLQFLLSKDPLFTL